MLLAINDVTSATAGSTNRIERFEFDRHSNGFKRRLPSVAEVVALFLTARRNPVHFLQRLGYGRNSKFQTCVLVSRDILIK